MRKWTINELSELKELRRDYTSGEIALLMRIPVKDVQEMISIQRAGEKREADEKAEAEQFTKTGKRKNGKWTKEMEDRLREMWEHASADELEQAIGLSYLRIASRASMLHLHRVRCFRPVKWTAEEDEIIRQHYTSATADELQQLLPGRTLKSIYAHAIRMGFVQQHGIKRAKWSDEETERLRKIYPNSTKEELLEAFPDRSFTAIRLYYRKIK